MRLPFSSVVITVHDAWTEWHHGFAGGASVVELEREKPWLKGFIACPWTAHQKSRQARVIDIVQKHVSTCGLQVALDKLEHFRVHKGYNLQTLGRNIKKLEGEIDRLFL